jgi:hypothetical protein
MSSVAHSRPGFRRTLSVVGLAAFGLGSITGTGIFGAITQQ